MSAAWGSPDCGTMGNSDSILSDDCVSARTGPAVNKKKKGGMKVHLGERQAI